jgi:hypothetical protein
VHAFRTRHPTGAVATFAGLLTRTIAPNTAITVAMMAANPTVSTTAGADDLSSTPTGDIVNYFVSVA